MAVVLKKEKTNPSCKSLVMANKAKYIFKGFPVEKKRKGGGRYSFNEFLTKLNKKQNDKIVRRIL